MDTSDRRVAPRINYSTTVIVLARHNAGVPCHIESISTSGARLVGPLTLEVGERIQLLFEVETRPVEVFGEVVRVSRDTLTTDRIAVKFVDLVAATRAVIRDFVANTLDLDDDAAPTPVDSS